MERAGWTRHQGRQPICLVFAGPDAMSFALPRDCIGFLAVLTCSSVSLFNLTELLFNRAQVSSRKENGRVVAAIKFGVFT